MTFISLVKKWPARSRVVSTNRFPTFKIAAGSQYYNIWR